MKKFTAILILLSLLSLRLFAQLDTSQVIYSWKLDPYSITRLPEKIDTNLAGFQIDNPIRRDFISASTTGNTGAPAISNIFTDRDLREEYRVTNVFHPAMKRISNTAYFHTRKPFSMLSYSNGGSSLEKEETFDAFHTQNVTPALNVGLNFTSQNARGQYLLQRVKNNSFRMFGSYSGNAVYSCHAVFNFNRITADENGGVLHDSLITDTIFKFSKEIPVLFGGTDQTNQHTPDVYRDIRNISFFTIQEVSFRKLFSSPDTAVKSKRIKIFYPKLAYIFSLDRSKILFTDKNPSVGVDAGLYPGVYVDENLTKDSLYYWRMQNALRLQFQGRRNNHYFIDFTHEAINYSQIVPIDTLRDNYFLYKDYNLPAANRRAQLYNTHLSSGFSRIFANALKLTVYGRYYLAGYQSTNYQLSGDIELMIRRKEKDISIKAGASNELLKPGFLYSRFVSNNFIWNQDLKQTNISDLSGDISLLSQKFELHADYFLLHNFVYFDAAAMPRQFQQALSVLSIVAEKEFQLWKLHSINRLAFQQVSNPDVLSLPALAVHSSNYLEHEFNFKATQGKLVTMIGFDLFYNTSYYANAYMPSLAVFYQQKEKMLGNHPYLDVFLNIRLKRVRFFLKYEHLNSGWLEKNFFTALHYPMNQRYLKTGISWTFYD
jgi:hypothetical protein